MSTGPHNLKLFMQDAMVENWFLIGRLLYLGPLFHEGSLPGYSAFRGGLSMGSFPVFSPFLEKITENSEQLDRQT